MREIFKWVLFGIMLILLLGYIYSCSSIPHKPIEVVDLGEVINRVEKDQAIPEDKKNYYLAELKQAQAVMKNQAEYIFVIEKKNAELQQTNDSLKISHKKEVDSLNSEIKSLSESKGRIKQMDYQFWGLIGIALLACIGFVLYLINKFGTKASPAGFTASLAEEAVKKGMGL